MLNEMTNWFKEEGEEESQESKTVEKENQPAPSAEKQPDETTPSSEGEDPAKVETNNDEEVLPFHKHPRFKALIDDKNELESKVTALTEQLKQFETSLPKEEAKAQPIPAWFVRAYGEDQELYNEYILTENAKIDAIQQSVMNRLAPKLQEIEKEEESKKINTFISSSLESIKEEFPGIDTNAVMKVVYEKKLFDESGQLNFRAGAEWVMNAPKATDTKLEAKKDVAAKLATNSAGEAPKKEAVTGQDLRKAGDWRSFYKSL